MEKIFLCFFMILSSGIAYADVWSPSKPVRIIIPAPPGSLHDSGFKSIQQIIEKTTGAEFIIEYKPGAAGVIATKYFLDLPVDDHTLLAATSISHVMSGITHPQVVSWNSFDDFQFVSGILTGTLVIANRHNHSINTPEKFLQHLKSADTKNPVTIGVTFPNQEVAIYHIIEFLGLDSKIVKFIKYNDPSKLLVDVVRGDVEFWIGAIPPTVSLYRSKEIQYIGSLSDRPLDFLPDVPLMKDHVSGLTQLSTVGVLMHKGSNPAAVKWFNEQISTAVRSDEAKKIRHRGLVSIDEESLTTDGFRNVMRKSFDNLSPGYRKIYK